MRLLLTGAFQYTKKHLEQIQKIGFEITYVQDEREELKIDVSEFKVVVCNNLFLHNDIRKFESLKVIQLTSAGFDRVPMDYIKEKNIEIYNSKNIYSVPMAEWVVLKILEIYKSSSYFYENQKIKKWQKKRDLLELTDKKIGIIGYGDVGVEIAKRLEPFDTQIIAINRSRIESNYTHSYVPLNELNQILPELDIVILAIALTKETESLISKKELSLMKDSSVLINVSRGELISEEYLIEALDNNKFLGVALDVFNEEPLRESPLWSFRNVLITPHNSFISDRYEERLFSVILKKLSEL